VQITPTQQLKRPNYSATWWRVADHDIQIHNHRATIVVVVQRCEGSGKLV